MNKKPKILMMTDNPLIHTGQAVVGRETALKLHATGKYEIIFAGWGYNGWPHNMPFPILPASPQDFGKGGFPQVGMPGLDHMIDNIKPDILWTNADIWMVNYISNHEIEIIGNKFKSIFDETKYLLLEEVSGSDIIKWYHYTKYSQNRGIMRGTGTLNSSCSGHAKNINMYEDNTDKVKLIILYENSSKEKISGRALLWSIDEPSIKYMDRIYTVNDSDVYLFQN